MARVGFVPSSDLPANVARIYEQYSTGYGQFRNQVAVFAHVPSAVEHIMGLLLDLKQQRNLNWRYVELAIVVTNSAQRIPERIFDALRAHFSEAQIVELTLRIALCGFFNRFNDALQIDNELEAIERPSAAG